MRNSPTGGTYDEGLQAISQVLGLRDVGQVGKSAVRMAERGFDLPVVSSAGFRAPDVKLPGITDYFTGLSTDIARRRETGQGLLAGGRDLLESLVTTPTSLDPDIYRVLATQPGRLATLGTAVAGTADEMFGGVQQPPMTAEDAALMDMMGMGSPQTAGVGVGQMTPEAQISQDRDMLMLQLIMSGSSISEAETIAELMTRIKYGQGAVTDQEEGEALSVGINELERLYAPGTEQSLSLGEKTVGVGGLLARGGRGLEKAFDQDYSNRLSAYNSMRDMVLGMINQARKAGTLNVSEAEVMMQSMPNEYTSETVARQWFQNIRTILGAQPQVTQEPTGDEALQQFLGF